MQWVSDKVHKRGSSDGSDWSRAQCKALRGALYSVLHLVHQAFPALLVVVRSSDGDGNSRRAIHMQEMRRVGSET